MSHPVPSIIQRDPDGYVAHPVGLKTVIVGKGETAAEALADAVSAIRFHLGTFAGAALDTQNPVLEVQVREARV